VAGCLYQTVWNVLTNKPARTGIRDYDLIYFDDCDLSWGAEDQVVQRVALRVRHLPAPVEVRNQARVHLWFKQRFGADYTALRCADEALTRYASVVHALGVRLELDGSLDIAAPFGLDDLFNMVIRPNRAIDNAASHEAKAARAKAIWPEVTVIRGALVRRDDAYNKETIEGLFCAPIKRASWVPSPSHVGLARLSPHYARLPCRYRAPSVVVGDGVAARSANHR
jgi:uncharacterized protein